MASEFAIVDLEPWYQGNDPGKIAVVDAVRAACEDTGFFLIRGHRIDGDLIKRLYDLSREYFDQPNDYKSNFSPTGPIPGGFEFFAMETEKLAATRGEVTPPDIKEAMDFGPGFGGGAWPDRPAGLKEVWYAYYGAMEELCRELRSILARAAGLPGDHFEPFFVDHLSSVRVINYPELAGDPLPGQLRAGAHTDYGFLTILLSEDRPGGLEVKNRQGNWVAPPTLPGTFIVNLGDSLMRWTNDMWHSTLHRVVNPPPDAGSGSRRQSIAFFHNPAKHALIDTLETFRRPDSPSKYPPITYGDYAIDRQEKSHGDYIVRSV